MQKADFYLGQGLNASGILLRATGLQSELRTYTIKYNRGDGVVESESEVNTNVQSLGPGAMVLHEGFLGANSDRCLINHSDDMIFLMPLSSFQGLPREGLVMGSLPPAYTDMEVVMTYRAETFVSDPWEEGQPVPPPGANVFSKKITILFVHDAVFSYIMNTLGYESVQL